MNNQKQMVDLIGEGVGEMLEKNRTKVLEVSFNQIQEFTKHMIERKNRSEETVKAYVRDLEQFEKFIQQIGGSLDDLTETDVNSFIKYLDKEKGFKAGTVERKANAIRQFCYFTDQSKAVVDVEFFIPKKQKTDEIAPDTLRRNEILAIQRIADTLNARERAIIYTLLWTGMRIGEVEHLNVKDLEFKNNGLIIVNRGKGNKEREIPFPPNIRHVVKKYLDLRSDDREELFISNKGNRMNKRTMQDLVERVNGIFNSTRREGDKINIHAHLFRHTYAKYLVDVKRFSVPTVQQLMGHENISTTERYLKKSMRDIAEELGNIGF